MTTGFAGFRGAGYAAIMLFAIAGFFSGCRSGVVSRLTQINTDKYYAVKKDNTAFFRYGPQQGNGPDMQLPRDTVVHLIRHSFGYSKVQLVPSGQQGYVASEDIGLAPPMLVAALTAPLPVAETTSPSVENFDLNSTVAPPDEALPAPDLPPAAPEATPL